MFIEDENRRRRLRLLIKKLNKERKRQAKKIDILCSDFITAQKNFIKKLNTIAFATSFYESILGTTDLAALLQTAVRLIRQEISDVNVTFFLRQEDDFQLHMFESEQSTAIESQHLENYFTAELIDNICKSNKICTMEDMFAMGLEGNLTGLNKLSAVTIPLGLAGSSLGFMLLYRSSENKLAAEELIIINAVTCGLSQAIQSCQALLHSTD